MNRRSINDTVLSSFSSFLFILFYFIFYCGVGYIARIPRTPFNTYTHIHTRTNVCMHARTCTVRRSRDVLHYKWYFSNWNRLACVILYINGAGCVLCTSRRVHSCRFVELYNTRANTCAVWNMLYARGQSGAIVILRVLLQRNNRQVLARWTRVRDYDLQWVTYKYVRTPAAGV